MAISPLKSISLLIVDPDREVSQVLRNALTEMGFRTIDIVRNGAQALQAIEKKPYDFVITDSDMPEMNGIDLTKYIRTAAGFPKPTLPVMMLTAKAERQDVEAARDAGVSEFVVRPFSIRTVFNRMVQLVDNPRNFIICEGYSGPDRRRKGDPPEGIEDRRKLVLKPEARITGGDGDNRPRMLLADQSLKLKLGMNVSLQSLIKPELLDQAQQVIDSMADESLAWIRADLLKMEKAAQMIIQGEKDGVALLSESALAIKSRAGTFGYGFASEVAFALSRFCRNWLEAANPKHHTVIKKHLEVLKVIFGTQMKGDTTPAGQVILRELAQLAEG